MQAGRQVLLHSCHTEDSTTASLASEWMLLLWAACCLQVQQSLISAFKACRKLSCRASGNSSLQLELSLLSLLQALQALGSAQGLPPDKVTAMSGKLSRAAAELLQESWQGPEDEAAEGDTGEQARGRGGVQLLASTVCTAEHGMLVGCVWDGAAVVYADMCELPVQALAGRARQQPSRSC